MSNVKIITRGVPSGYGYIRKFSRRKGSSKYWPVRLKNTSLGYEYLIDENGNPEYSYSHDDVLRIIQGDINNG